MSPFPLSLMFKAKYHFKAILDLTNGYKINQNNHNNFNNDQNS